MEYLVLPAFEKILLTSIQMDLLLLKLTRKSLQKRTRAKSPERAYL